MNQAAKLTLEQRTTMLHGARQGLSFTGIARLVGRSRAWLSLVRVAEPDFESNLLMMLGEYEQQLVGQRNEAIASGNAAVATALSKMLAQRFPQLHGEDPRLRYSVETAGEEHAEDASNASTQDPGLFGIDPKRLAAYLDQRLAERDAR